jgi:hypothetical protein
MNKLTQHILSLGLASTLLAPLAYAELKEVDDATLADVEGQAGLTIDIDMGVNVGEFMYKDAGSIVMQGIRFGGMNRCGDVGGENGTVGQDTWCSGDNEVGTAFGKNGEYKIVNSAADRSSSNSNAGGTTGFNNARVVVDIAGSGAIDGYLDTGFIDGLGNPITIPTYDSVVYWAWGDLAAPALSCEVAGGRCALILEDGDLFIHGTVTDTTIAARSYQSVDFGFEMDLFALKASTYAPGQDMTNNATTGTSESTTIISNLKMEGFIGGFDLLLENGGNGFGATDLNGNGRIDDAENSTSTGYGDANSKLVVNSFFEITEMQYDFDIVGIKYRKMAIHNLRGDLGMFDFDQSDFANSATSQGFAQSNTQLYAVKDNILSFASGTPELVDGISLNTRLRADMDIGYMSFGDTDISIGSQHWTDMDVYNNLTISAH